MHSLQVWLSPHAQFDGFSVLSEGWRGSITSLSPAKTHRDKLSSDIGADHKLDDLNGTCNTFTAEISIMGALTASSSFSNWNVWPLRQSEISFGLKLMRVLLIAGFLLYFKSKLEQLKSSPPRSSLSWLAPPCRTLEEESGSFRYLWDGCTLWGNLKYKIKCKQKPN